MTEDLHDSLRRAADPGDRRLRTTPGNLLAKARRDRRRHRIVAAGGGSAVAVVAVGAMVLGFSSLPGTDEPGRSNQGVSGQSDEPSGLYERVRVNEAEAVRRCGLQLENSGLRLPERVDGEWQLTEVDWSRPHDWRIDRNLKQVEPNWRDYFLVEGGTPTLEYRFHGEQWDGGYECTVPQADLAAESGRIQGDPVDAADSEGILRQCGEIAGFDFTGWSVVNAMDALGGVEAVLESTNDHTARCTIEAPDNVYADPAVSVQNLSDADIAQYNQSGDAWAGPYCVTLEGYRPASDLSKAGNGGGENVYTGSGNLYRPNGKLATNVAKLRIDLPNGTTVTQQVHDGKYAIRAADQASPGAEAPMPVALLDSEGNVIEERNAMDWDCFDD